MMIVRYTPELNHDSLHNNLYYAAVVIGFSDSNTSVVLNEGAPFSPICISIKQGGFSLHPRGNLELTIQTESIGIQ